MIFEIIQNCIFSILSGLLIYFSSDNKNKFIYKLTIDKKTDIELLKKEINKIQGVTNIEVRYGD